MIRSTLFRICFLAIAGFYLGCMPVEQAVAQPIEPGYEITVSVKGFGAEEAYLAHHFGNQQYIKDTATVSQGNFTFKGDSTLDGGMYMIVLPPENKWFEVIIDKDQYFSISTDTTDFVANMKVEGCKENEVFYGDLQYIRNQREKINGVMESLKTAKEGSSEFKSLSKERDKINEAVVKYRTDLVEDNPELFYAKILKAVKDPVIPEPPDGADENYRFYYYRTHFFDDIDFGDRRMLRTPILYNKTDQYIERLTQKHPDSINVSIDKILDLATDTTIFRYFVQTFLNKYANSKIMGMDGVYAHIVDSYYMKGRAYWVDDSTLTKLIERALAITPTLVGRKAPNIKKKRLTGEQFDLHQVKAEYTLLYFWDYDCGHCKTVTPTLVKAYENYIDKDVELVTVQINGDPKVWLEKLEEYGIKGIPLFDATRTSGISQYDLRSTPRLFILDKDKKILAKQISVDQMEDVLNRELGIEVDEAEEDSGEAENEKE